MKKFICALLTLTLLLSTGAYAASYDGYEYILKPEYQSIAHYYWYDDYYIARDKNGKEALYGSDGYKITGDYDKLYCYDKLNRFMLFAEKDGITQLLNNQGTVMADFGKSNIIGYDVYYVYTDISGNDDGRPLNYYEGEFAVHTHNGEHITNLSYDRYLPPKNYGYGMEMSCGRMIFFENGKCGAVDSEFNPVVEPIYDKLMPYGSNGLAVALKNGKYGIIDTDGNTVTDFVYDSIITNYDSDSVKVYKVTIGEKHGMLSPTGELIMELSAERIPEDVDYSYRLIKYRIENTRDDKDEYGNLYGLMDFEGNTVLPAEHISIEHISDGRIPAKKAYDKGGYYSLSGEEITEFKYRMISPYSEGLAFASAYDGESWTHDVIDIHGNVKFNSPDHASGFYGSVAYCDKKFIDTNGNIIAQNNEWTQVDFSSWWMPDRNGVFKVETENGYGMVKLRKMPDEPIWNWEYIDNMNMKDIADAPGGYEITTNDGEKLYVDAQGNFTDNAVAVLGRNVIFSDGKYRLYDDNNKLIMTFPHNAQQFGEYIYTLTNEENNTDNTFAIYRKDGTKLFEGSCDEYRDEGTGWKYIDENGYWTYHTTEGLYGLADAYGNNIVPPEYDSIIAISGRYYLKKGDSRTVIDKDKNLIAENLPDYDSIYTCENVEKDYIILEHGGKTTVLNMNYESVIELDGKSIVRFFTKDAFAYSSKKHNCGLMDITGRIIIPEEDLNIEYLGENIFRVNGPTRNFYLINLDGQIIASECEYVTDMGDNSLIGISKKNFEGYINSKGEVIITLDKGYQVQGAFSEGLASVVTNNIYSRYGDTSYVNEQGRLALKGDDVWCMGGEFHSGVAHIGVKLGKAGATASMLVKCTYDTPSDWAKETVEEAILSGLLPEKHRQRYRRNITREAFCEIAYELDCIKNAQPTGESISFSDTDNEKVTFLSRLGIINGVGEGRFAPDSHITREEAATILNRIYNLTGKKALVDTNIFADDSNISDWAKEAVYSIKNIGVMNGVGDNMFAPKDNYTTEQAIATILRLDKAIG